MTREEILIAYKENKYDITEVLDMLSKVDSTTKPLEPQNKRNVFQNMIYENIVTPLSTVAHHHDIDCIERYFSDKFPAHLAIHCINDAKEQKREYTELHMHEEQEINIIIGDKGIDLVCELQLGNEVFEVKSNSSIWIPSGLMHSCNVIKGTGYYVALRLKPDETMVEKFIHNFSI